MREPDEFLEALPSAPKPELSPFRKSIIEQESGGYYGAIGQPYQKKNGSTASMDEGEIALGKYQIVPKWWFEKLGLDPKNAEHRQRFLDDPDLQDLGFDVVIEDGERLYPGDYAKQAAHYYGGKGGVSILGTAAGDKPQSGGHPSVNRYANEVTGRLSGAGAPMAAPGTPAPAPAASTFDDFLEAIPPAPGAAPSPSPAPAPALAGAAPAMSGFDDFLEALPVAYDPKANPTPIPGIPGIGGEKLPMPKPTVNLGPGMSQAPTGEVLSWDPKQIAERERLAAIHTAKGAEYMQAQAASKPGMAYPDMKTYPKDAAPGDLTPEAYQRRKMGAPSSLAATLGDLQMASRDYTTGLLATWLSGKTVMQAAGERMAHTEANITHKKYLESPEYKAVSETAKAKSAKGEALTPEEEASLKADPGFWSEVGGALKEMAAHPIDNLALPMLADLPAMILSGAGIGEFMRLAKTAKQVQGLKTATQASKTLQGVKRVGEETVQNVGGVVTTNYPQAAAMGEDYGAKQATRDLVTGTALTGATMAGGLGAEKALTAAEVEGQAGRTPEEEALRQAHNAIALVDAREKAIKAGLSPEEVELFLSSHKHDIERMAGGKGLSFAAESLPGDVPQPVMPEAMTSDRNAKNSSSSSLHPSSEMATSGGAATPGTPVEMANDPSARATTWTGSEPTRQNEDPAALKTEGDTQAKEVMSDNVPPVTPEVKRVPPTNKEFEKHLTKLEKRAAKAHPSEVADLILQSEVGKGLDPTVHEVVKQDPMGALKILRDTFDARKEAAKPKKVEPESAEPVERGLPFTQSNYSQAKRWLTRRGKTATDAEIADFLKNHPKNEPIPKDQGNKVGDASSTPNTMARTHSIKELDHLLRDGDPALLETTTLPARALPKEFEIGGVKMVRMKPEPGMPPDLIRYRDVRPDGARGTPFEFKADDLVHMGSKWKEQPKEAIPEDTGGIVTAEDWETGRHFQKGPPKASQEDMFGNKGRTASEGFIKGKGDDKGLEGTPLFDGPKREEQVRAEEDQQRLFDVDETPRDPSQNAEPEARAIDEEDAEGDHRYAPPERVHVASRLRRVAEEVQSGRITPDEARQRIEELSRTLDDNRFIREINHGMQDRTRGADYIREKLLNARRHRHLSDEEFELTTWFVERNPHLVANLGISVRNPMKGMERAAGFYNSMSRVITLIKNNGNTQTGVHEILHHTERMLPPEARRGILKEYAKQFAKEFNGAHWKKLKALELISRAVEGDLKAQREMMEQFGRGEIPRSMYHLSNPSEFWAVNGARILAARHGSEGWIGRARQWLKEFIQHVRGQFGLKSDSAILRGLRDVIRGEGRYLGTQQLHESRGMKLMDVKPEKNAGLTDREQYEWKEGYLDWENASDGRKARVTDLNQVKKAHYEKVDKDRAEAKAKAKTAEDKAEEARLDEIFKRKPEELELYQAKKDDGAKPKGSYHFDKALDKHVITLFIGRADLSTLFHEYFHYLEQGGLINASDRALLARALKQAGYENPQEADGRFSKDAAEKLARWYERYLRNGDVKIEGMEAAFGKIATRMREIYPSVNSGPLKAQIPEHIRELFDRVQNREGEATGLPGEATGLPGEATGLPGEAAKLHQDEGPGPLKMKAEYKPEKDADLEKGISRNAIPGEIRSGFLTPAEAHYSDWVNRGFPIEKIQRYFEKAYGTTTKAADDLKLKMMRVFGAGASAELHIQKHLEPIYKDMTPEETRMVDRLALARDAIWRYDHTQGFDFSESFSLRAVNTELRKARDLEKSNPELARKIKKAADALVDYGKDLAQKKMNAGIWSEDEFKMWTKNPYYIPEIRDWSKVLARDVGSVKKRSFTSTNNLARGTHAAAETLDVPVFDPITALIHDTRQLAIEAAKGAVWKKIVELVDQTPELRDKGWFRKALPGEEPLSHEGKVSYLGTVNTHLTEPQRALANKYQSALMTLEQAKDERRKREDDYTLNSERRKIMERVQRLPEGKRAVFAKDMSDIIANVEKSRQKHLENKVKKANETIDHFRKLPEADQHLIEDYLDEGKPITMIVPRELAEAVNGMDPMQMDGYKKVLLQFATLFRKGAVSWNPAFTIANVGRDLQEAWFNTGMNPFWAFKNFIHAAKKDEIYEAYIKAGGGMSGDESGFRQSSATADKIRYPGRYDKLKDKDAKAVAFGKEWDLKGLNKAAYALTQSAKAPLDLFEAMAETGELMTRLGVFEYGQKKMLLSPQQAAHLARQSTIDFNRIGSKMRDYNALIPFLNARIQGLDRIARTSKGDPGAAAFRAFTLAGVPTLLLTAWNMQNPNYSDIPTWEKEYYWILMRGKTGRGYLKIAKGTIASFLTNPMQMVWETNVGTASYDGWTFAKSLMKAGLPVDDPAGLLDPLRKTLVEEIANENFYFDRDIVRDKARNAEDQWDGQTSEALKELGHVVKLSPERMQHMIQSLTGGTGTNVLYLADAMTGLAKGLKRGDALGGMSMAVKGKYIPILSKLYNTTNDWKSDFANQQRELLKKIEDTKKSMHGKGEFISGSLRGVPSDTSDVAGRMQRSGATLEKLGKKLSEVSRALQSVDSLNKALEENHPGLKRHLYRPPTLPPGAVTLPRPPAPFDANPEDDP